MTYKQPEFSWMRPMWKINRAIIVIGITGCLAVGVACKSSTPQQGLSIRGPRLVNTQARPHDFSKWEPEIAAYEAADRANPPPKGAILFIGSSTIRLWSTLQQDFPQHQVINRGFGGSEIADATHFADRIIFPYEPKYIFLRAGNNDIHNGRLPGELAADFAAFVETVHERLPRTEIIFISLCPVPDRWPEKDKNRLLNTMIRRMALSMPHVSYVDAWNVSLTKQRHARPELFRADKLHFNEEGYKLLAERVRPYLPVIK